MQETTELQNYTADQFLEEVMAEIEAIKTNATEEEKSRLDLLTFNPKHPRRCIYGQMTGDCRTVRATELILKGCKRYMYNDFNNYPNPDITLERNFIPVKKVSNGTTVNWDMALGGDLIYLSSLETYIVTPYANNKDILAYIKGEIDTLTLNRPEEE